MSNPVKAMVRAVVVAALMAFSCLVVVSPAAAGPVDPSVPGTNDYPYNPPVGDCNLRIADCTPDGWGAYKWQCTSFAAWRMRQSGVTNEWFAWGNGGQWDDTARAKGYPVDKTPAPGALAVWDGSPGHVAYVSAVRADGYVGIEDYNKNYDQAYSKRWVNPATISWFIHIKDKPAISAEWVNHPGQAKRMALTRGATTARPWVAFHIGYNNVIYRKRAGDAGWTGMASTSAKEVAAMTNGDGRVEVFNIGLNGRLYHSWQSTPDGAYSSWVDRGGSWLAVAVTKGSYRGWQAFAVGTDRRLYRLAPWDGLSTWTVLPGTAELNRVAAMTNPDGRIELLVSNVHGTMYQSWQSAVRSPFGAWTVVPGQARDVGLVPKAGGGWSMYHVGYGRNLFVRTSSNTAWRQFNGVGDFIAVSQNADGREELFHINKDNGSMWHAWQRQAGVW